MKIELKEFLIYLLIFRDTSGTYNRKNSAQLGTTRQRTSKICLGPPSYLTLFCDTRFLIILAMRESSCKSNHASCDTPVYCGWPSAREVARHALKSPSSCVSQTWPQASPSDRAPAVPHVSDVSRTARFFLVFLLEDRGLCFCDRFA